MPSRLAPKSKILAYDAQAAEIGYFAPEVIFGLSYSFVNAGDTLLDIGIGTGLSSALFHKAGLKIIGMDLSTDMLDYCRSKNIATKLDKHDLLASPYPYDDASIDIAICVGVLLHFQNLEVPFNEVGRIIREDGIFAFMVADRKRGESHTFTEKHKEDAEEMEITLYRHDPEYINKLLNSNNMTVLRELEFNLTISCDKKKPSRAKAYIARKQNL